MKLTINKKQSASSTALLYFAIAFAMAIFLTFLPIDAFKDRLNYLVYAENSLSIFYRYLDRGVLNALFNEPVWLFINVSLSWFLVPEKALRVIIFFSAFTSFYLALKNNSGKLLLVAFFLLSPLVVGKYIIHLRQGLAISFFLIGWYASNKKIRFVFFALTPFIHASFFFILVLYLINWFATRLKFAVDIKSILYIAAGLGLGLGLGLITKYLGARQGSEYSFSMANVSGLGFVFWLGVLSLYVLQGRQFIRQNTFQIGALLFYLATYFLIEVTGRIFESAVLLVLLSSLSLTSWRKYAFITAFLSFTLLQYIARYSQPWLGWGTGA